MGTIFAVITIHLYVSRPFDMFTDTYKSQSSSLPPALPPAELESFPQNSQERGQEVRMSDEYRGFTVMYHAGIFSPDTILIKPVEGNESCALQIENKDAEEILIRLGPFSEKDNRGFSYDPIPPGTSLVIDPRYGMTEEFFYNRARPGATFRVLLDKKCFL